MSTSEGESHLRTFGDLGIDDVPGKFSAAAELSGDVAEAEHLARYRWATQFAEGRRVLDAGCGWAYGTAMLAEAGAISAAGVDLAPTVIETAQAELGDAVQLKVGDVRELPYPDAQFDLVVCFEVIEHIEDHPRALDELQRVLAPGGLLVLSSPNLFRSPEGNPYHVHEFEPAEFAEVLGARFANVEIFRQHAWVVSAVVSAETSRAGGLGPVDDVALGKGVVHADGEEDYMVALASDATLPTHAVPHAVATADVELRRWLGLFAEQDKVLQGQREFIDGLDLARVGEMARELEQAAGREAELTAALRDARDELDTYKREYGDEITHLTAMLERADRVRDDIFRSLSWRITAPLRRLKS
ncbi:MAG: methyltransferase domain-containing protein [Patulibacter minatonensis]